EVLLQPMLEADLRGMAAALVNPVRLGADAAVADAPGAPGVASLRLRSGPGDEAVVRGEIAATVRPDPGLAAVHLHERFALDLAEADVDASHGGCRGMREDRRKQHR